jgi:hypothetical protein
VADRPLRPATDRRLGRPLPHQLPNRTQAAPKTPRGFDPQAPCGISPSFPGLSPISGYVPTRYSPVRRCQPKPAARLACVKHAASVRSEPGSNSQVHPTPAPHIPEHQGQSPSQPKLHSPLPIPPQTHHRPTAPPGRVSLPKNQMNMSINKPRPTQEQTRTSTPPKPNQHKPNHANQQEQNRMGICQGSFKHRVTAARLGSANYSTSQAAMEAGQPSRGQPTYGSHVSLGSTPTTSQARVSPSQPARQPDHRRARLMAPCGSAVNSFFDLPGITGASPRRTWQPCGAT